MSRALKPAAVKAGLGQWVVANGLRHAESWVLFHTFRHTCATVLFEAGWNAKQVQLQLGHHKPSFTLDTYIHLMPGDLPRIRGATRGATRPTENDRETAAAKAAETMEVPAVPRLAEVAGARS